jgi:hypothetical protein
VLLRTDLWRILQFTNKSHLTDKTIELRWSSDQIATLLLKRAVTDELVWEFVAERQERLLEVLSVEDLSRDELRLAIESVLPASAYPGQNEASIIDWLVARVTDGQGTVLPREAILLCKTACGRQLESGGPSSGDSLISREVIRESFTELSRIRCSSYLAEFPALAEHVHRFRGQTSATFGREALLELMRGLSPAGDDLLREFCDIGLIQPVRGDVATADSFEVPRLYRPGLGLVIPGRP